MGAFTADAITAGLDLWRHACAAPPVVDGVARFARVAAGTHRPACAHMCATADASALSSAPHTGGDRLRAAVHCCGYPAPPCGGRGPTLTGHGTELALGRGRCSRQ